MWHLQLKFNYLQLKNQIYEIFLSKHSNVYEIDHHAQWSVDPRFQQIQN